jgi:hypothetical protein
MGIRENATKLLLMMSNYKSQDNDPNKGRYEFRNDELPDLTGLRPEDLNDAVDILESNGYAKPMRYLGTHPYTFASVELTPRGRLEAERVESASTEAKPKTKEATTVANTPLPVGSPYGFTLQNWEAVSLDHNSPEKLIVVFGYQWKSDFYDAAKLSEYIKQMFELALARSLPRLGLVCELHFRPLQAGYGSHLFNRIARDIISADIAVFDTSDLNPNVMIEMGVALTWGVRVLPIRSQDAPKPPSDISGHTWAEYTASGQQWNDPDHSRKLEEMVALAVRRKPAHVPE